MRLRIEINGPNRTPSVGSGRRRRQTLKADHVMGPTTIAVCL